MKKIVFSGQCRAAMAALVYMMNKGGQDATHTLSTISRDVGVSISYLEQIFSKLRKANLVMSVRGPGGGYIISRNISTITITDVVFALEPPRVATPFQTLICSHLSTIKLEQMVNYADEIF
ncbi:TPA: Rrf2 family transcriptional regulator [Enterobacter cloacae]